MLLALTAGRKHSMSDAEKLEMHMQIQEERRIKVKKERMQTDPIPVRSHVQFTRGSHQVRENIYLILTCARHCPSAL